MQENANKTMKEFDVTVTQSFTVKVKALCAADAANLATSDWQIRQEIETGMTNEGFTVTDVQECEETT